jgi:preprotein translocase subunit SecG
LKSNAEIYPFAVEVTRNRVPVMHLLTRIMATVGGVFTIMSLIDGALYSREKKKIGGGSRR